MAHDLDLPIYASFLESVASSRVRDLVEDVAELTLDAITDDEVLKQIPIVKTFLALKGVRERFLLRKTYRFFAKLREIPQEERERFVSRMRADPRKARQVGESFAIWLERLDNEEKAELFAKVFELYARGKIDFDRSARFASVIDRAHVPFLLRLRSGVTLHGDWDDDVRAHLLALGLLSLTARQRDVDDQKWRDVPAWKLELIKMELNEDGRVFQDYVMKGIPG